MPSRCTGVVAAARTQGKRAQHGKPQSVVRDDQPDAREGQAGRFGVAERLGVPLKPGNAGGGKGPQFKADARHSAGHGDWATSHGELWVKSGIHSGMCQTPRAVSVSEVRARLHDATRFRARSTSHTVAARDGCTNIPLAAGRGSGDETILSIGISGHGYHRFVHPDPPELIRSWEI